MKPKLCSLLLVPAVVSVVAAADGPPSYYNNDLYGTGNKLSPAAAAASRNRIDLRLSGARDEQSTGSASMGERRAHTGESMTSFQSLPAGMERGLQDVEAGIEELRSYSSIMADHIQRNGLRGFIDVPPAIRQQGNAIGKRIGGGIGEVMNGVTQEMIVPDGRQ